MRLLTRSFDIWTIIGEHGVEDQPDEMPDFLWMTRHGILAMRNHSLMGKAATI